MSPCFKGDIAQRLYICCILELCRFYDASQCSFVRLELSETSANAENDYPSGFWQLGELLLGMDGCFAPKIKYAILVVAVVVYRRHRFFWWVLKTSKCARIFCVFCFLACKFWLCCSHTVTFQPSELIQFCTVWPFWRLNLFPLSRSLEGAVAMVFVSNEIKREVQCFF